MAKLEEHIRIALDETRILVLGMQVLLGFQLRGVFEERFSSLPPRLQSLHLLVAAGLILALTLVIIPGTFHRVVERGEMRRSVVRVASALMNPALALFGAAIALAAFTVLRLDFGFWFATLVSGGILLTAASWFFGIELLMRRARHPALKRRRAMHPHEEEEKVDNAKKIELALTEARVVLPGAQALLGFQFATFLLKAFTELSRTAKLVHVASMACIAVTTILLLSLAAWHRLVERGEMTAHFHRVATRLLLAAMVPLAVGIGLDFGLVVYKALESVSAGIVAGAVVVVVMLAAWFGFTLLARAARERRSRAGEPQRA